MIEQYRWTKEQNTLFASYGAIIVASEHMRQEYVLNGAPEERVRVIPLFPTNFGNHQTSQSTNCAADRASASSRHVLVMGRMTSLKGGDLPLRAVAVASRRIARPISVTMAGDGPQRQSWESLARRLGVSAAFPGWVTGGTQTDLLKSAAVLAVPSVWPEPFGLVGLEAAAMGVPAIAFDVGGVREWLHEGINGYLVRADPPTAEGFAGALVRAFTRPDELTGMRDQARAVARRMSLDKHLLELEHVLTQVLSRGGARCN